MEEVSIWSDGTRMAGDLYRPADHMDGSLRPAIVCCHGWSRPLKHHLAETGFPQALSAAGYFVLAFDYRGWGASDGMPFFPDSKIAATGPVEIVREVLDPFQWALDIRHAIDFIEGEPGVDPDRIGLAGWSLGGGMVVWMAAHDERVKCVVGTAGAHDFRGQEPPRQHVFPMWSRDEMRRAAIERARSDRDRGPFTFDGADGRPRRVSPDVRFFAPIDCAEQVDVPVLFIDAGQEAMWDIREHAARAYERSQAAGRAPVEYRVLPGIDHMGIYEPSSGATELARSWFDRHLAEP
jgi:dienelactone hydrolase